MLLSIRGDGKRHSFRVRLDDAYDGIAYQETFSTEKGEWVTVKIPFGRLSPTYGGQQVPGAPPMDPAKIRQLGLLISGKQEGSFKLEIAQIGACAE